MQGLLLMLSILKQTLEIRRGIYHGTAKYTDSLFKI